MRKTISLLFAALIALTASAEDYGIKVGGVSVTSSNYTYVTGSAIQAYDTNKSYSVKYDPGTKTLTLRNVKIDRTGSDNRALYNTGCAGLTVIFEGENWLKAQDAAPLRFEKNTTIKCKNPTSIQGVRIIGDKEDAIYLTNGVILTLDSAVLSVSGGNNSHAIVGKNATERLWIKKSSLWIQTASTKYGLWDLAEVRVESSAVQISHSSSTVCPVKNVKKFSLTGGVLLPQLKNGSYTNIVYSGNKKTFLFKTSDSTEVTTDIVMCNALKVDQVAFPDATFRDYVRNYGGGYDGYLITENPYGQTLSKTYDEQFIHSEVTGVTSIDLRDKGITSLKGIEYYTKLQGLYVSDNSLTSLDLSKNPLLERLNCSNNAITSLKLPTTDALRSVLCEGNRLTSLNLSAYPNLETVNCTNNKLTSLKLPTNAPLKEVLCHNNQLTSLKLPASTELTFISCYGNQINGNNVTALINSLPDASGSLRTHNINMIDHSNTDELNECTAEQVVMAKGRGWDMLHSENGTSWAATTGCYNYDLWVKDTQMRHTTSNAFYRFNALTKVLTLTEDASLVADENSKRGAAIWSNLEGLTIEVAGRNTLIAANDNKNTVFLGRKTTIQGWGTLEVKGGDVGIYQLGDTLTIRTNFTSSSKSLTVKAQGKTCGLLGNDDASGNYYATLCIKDDNYKLSVQGNTTDYETYSGIDGWKEIILEGKHRVVSPMSAVLAEHGILNSNNTPILKQWVTIDNYSPIKYKLIYVVDGETWDIQYMEEGTNITLKDGPEKEGYTFKGWGEVPTKMPDHDVTVTAAYQINRYTLEYYIERKFYEMQKITYGETITPLTAPEKEGYTFNGWEGLPETMPAERVIVNGTYTVNKYKLIYLIDGNPYKTIELNYGEKVNPEGPAEDDDYYYAWEDEPETMPAHDVEVHAVITGIGAEERVVNIGKVEIYSAEGKRLHGLQKGVNIIRFENGKTKKVIVK
ncbi:MAG: InlB B-repeat-containing protein [Bacteroidaceae bacterium]|nr:InlB B-repeat-containing protein [Bacteroidaceae bacterium]